MSLTPLTADQFRCECCCDACQGCTQAHGEKCPQEGTAPTYIWITTSGFGDSTLNGTFLLCGSGGYFSSHEGITFKFNGATWTLTIDTYTYSGADQTDYNIVSGGFVSYVSGGGTHPSSISIPGGTGCPSCCDTLTTGTTYHYSITSDCSNCNGLTGTLAWSLGVWGLSGLVVGSPSTGEYLSFSFSCFGNSSTDFIGQMAFQNILSGSIRACDTSVHSTGTCSPLDLSFTFHCDAWVGHCTSTYITVEVTT